MRRGRELVPCREGRRSWTADGTCVPRDDAGCRPPSTSADATACPTGPELFPPLSQPIDHISADHGESLARFPLFRRAGTRKVKPIWILLKQETVSGSGISWAVCKSAPRPRQITMPAPHLSVFYRPDALPAVQPTVSKH